MSVVDVIRTRTETVALSRRDGITIVDGLQVLGTPLTSNILAHVQPAQGKDMTNAPEGQRQEETRMFWTETELRVADSLTVGGTEFIVQHIDPWNDIDGWNKALATEVTDVIP